MSVTFNNTVFGAGQSETGAFALNSFTGTAVLSGTAPVTINGTIDQPNASTVSINLNAGPGLTATGATGTYLGYSPADANGNYVYYFAVNGGGLVTPVTIGVSSSTVPTVGVATPVNTTPVTAPVCFVTGTRIRTVRGEIAVEDLVVGDHVITAAGAERPIAWIGRREMNFAGAANRLDALPIRIRADAVAAGVPSRDLVVSPGHRIFLDEVLVQACHLVNGTTIVREELDRATYWHVELESHDVLVAENLPSESYVEAANRASFDNGEVVFGNRPTVSLTISQPLCAPLIDGGPQLHAIRERLMARSGQLDGRTTRDPGLQLVADGLVLTPTDVHDWQFAYDVPEGTAQLVLRSRTAVPAETLVASTDMRELGVCLRMLTLDGSKVAIDDPRLGDGFNEPEDNGTFRWTRGEARLPVARRVAFRVTPMPVYALPAIDAASANPLQRVG